MEKGYTKILADKVKSEMKKITSERDEFTDITLSALLSAGHILIEGPSGTGKILWSKAFAKILNLKFEKIRFTEDLTPSDIFSDDVYKSKTLTKILSEGSLFTGVFLAEDINKATPKLRSALSEIADRKSKMEEKQVFFIIASQVSGTGKENYGIVDSLTDNFMMKLIFSHMDVVEEKKILKMYSEKTFERGFEYDLINPVCSLEELNYCKEEVAEVTLDEDILNYIVSITETTRRMNAISSGVGTEGSINLYFASKAFAAIQGRDYVTTEDVKSVALPVLRHRISLKADTEANVFKTDSILTSIIQAIKFKQ